MKLSPPSDIVRLIRLLPWPLRRAFLCTATGFDWLYRRNPDPFGVEHTPYECCKREALLKIVAQRHHTHALDLGCGPGIQTKHLAAYCDHILGIDFSVRAISLAKARCKDEAKIAFSIEDIRTFCRRDRHPLYPKYDLLVCSEVLSYLDVHSLKNVIESLATMSTPNAWLILVGSANDSFVVPKFASRLILIDQIENSQWPRPFAISLFTVPDNQWYEPRGKPRTPFRSKLRGMRPLL